MEVELPKSDASDIIKPQATMYSIKGGLTYVRSVYNITIWFWSIIISNHNALIQFPSSSLKKVLNNRQLNSVFFLFTHCPRPHLAIE